MGSRKLWGWMAFIVLVFVLAGEHKTETQKAEHQHSQNDKRATQKTGYQQVYKAASQGNALDESLLGEMYFSGIGVQQNYRKGFYWVHKAAVHGNAISEGMLGALYYVGQQGVIQNYRKAFFWYKKSASQGNALAEVFLGEMYQKGLSVQQNYRKGFYWVHKAATQGNARGEALTGILYYNGQGVPQNYVNAYMWFALAKAMEKPGSNSYQMLSDGMRRARANMTPGQIARAQSMAGAWERVHGK